MVPALQNLFGSTPEPPVGGLGAMVGGLGANDSSTLLPLPTSLGAPDVASGEAKDFAVVLRQDAEFVAESDVHGEHVDYPADPDPQTVLTDLNDASTMEGELLWDQSAFPTADPGLPSSVLLSGSALMPDVGLEQTTAEQPVGPGRDVSVGDSSELPLDVLLNPVPSEVVQEVAMGLGLGLGLGVRVGLGLPSEFNESNGPRKSNESHLLSLGLPLPKQEANLGGRRVETEVNPEVEPEPKPEPTFASKVDSKVEPEIEGSGKLTATIRRYSQPPEFSLGDPGSGSPVRPLASPFGGELEFRGIQGPVSPEAPTLPYPADVPVAAEPERMSSRVLLKESEIANAGVAVDPKPRQGTGASVAGRGGRQVATVAAREPMTDVAGEFQTDLVPETVTGDIPETVLHPVPTTVTDDVARNIHELDLGAVVKLSRSLGRARKSEALAMEENATEVLETEAAPADILDDESPLAQWGETQDGSAQPAIEGTGDRVSLGRSAGTVAWGMRESGPTGLGNGWGGATVSPAAELLSPAVGESVVGQVVEALVADLELAGTEFASLKDVKAPGGLRGLNSIAGRADSEAVVAKSASVRQLSIEVHPAELGRMEIFIGTENESLNAMIIASDPMTSELLVREKMQLISALQEQGIEISDLEISYQEQDRRGFDSQQFGPPRREVEERLDQPAAVEPEGEPSETPVHTDGDSTIDVMA